jgi:hypothetical protein
MKVRFHWSARPHEPPFLVIDTWQGVEQISVGMELRMSVVDSRIGKVRIERIESTVFLGVLMERRDGVSTAESGHIDEMKVYVG